MSSKTLIGMPVATHAHPKTYKSIWDFVRPYEADLEIVSHYDTAESRNKLASFALENGYDRLLFVDSDIVLQRNTFRCLMEDFDEYGETLGAVLGLYRPSSNPLKSLVYLPETVGYDAEKRPSYEELEAISEKQGSRVFDIKAGGLGIALVNAKIFSNIPKPWFAFDQRKLGDLPMSLSEDLYFCQKTIRCGYKLVVDIDAKCGHVKEQVLW